LTWNDPLIFLAEGTTKCKILIQHNKHEQAKYCTVCTTSRWSWEFLSSFTHPYVVHSLMVLNVTGPPLTCSLYKKNSEVHFKIAYLL